MEKWYTLVLDEDTRVKGSLDIDEGDLFGRDDSDLELGKRLRKWDRRIYLRSSSPDGDGPPDDVLCTHLGTPVFSPRLQQALAEANVGQRNLQYLPVHVYLSTGKEIEGSAFANIVTRIKALDYDKSEMLWLDDDNIDPATGKPEVLGVWTVALKGKALKGHEVIRLTEYFPSFLVSQRFVDVFKEGGFTGASFLPVHVT